MTLRYTPFRFDLTDVLAYGAKNYIALRVDASFGDGWFYEGAGIYRHVWLLKTDPVHLVRWESVVRSNVEGDHAALSLSNTVENETDRGALAMVNWKIVDSGGATVATAEARAQRIAGGEAAVFHATANLAHPKLWSLEIRRVPKENLSKCIRASSCRCIQALFFDVRAEKADQRCSTSRLPQCGQAVSFDIMLCDGQKLLECFLAGVTDELIVGHTDLPQSLTDKSGF